MVNLNRAEVIRIYQQTLPHGDDLIRQRPPEDVISEYFHVTKIEAKKVLIQCGILPQGSLTDAEWQSVEDPTPLPSSIFWHEQDDAH